VPDDSTARATPWVRLAGYATAILLLAQLGAALARGADAVATLWPVSGLALGVLLQAPRAAWPAYLAAGALPIAAFNLAAGQPPGLVLAFTLGNLVEPALGAWLVLRATGRRRPSANDARTLPAVVAGGLAAAVIANAVPALALAGAGAPLLATWPRLWLGSALGILAVTPLFQAWRGAAWPRPSPRRLLEAGALAVAFAASGWFVFLADAPFSFGPALFPPLLVWAALRFGPRGATLGSAALTVLVLWGTSRGHGFFVAVPSTLEPGLSAQAFAALAHVAVLWLTGVIEARQRAAEAQRRSERQAEEALRLATVGTLAAGIAHELNNPLAAMLVNLDFAKEELALRRASPEEAEGAIARVAPAIAETLEAAQRARDIVRDLRIFSRADDGQEAGLADVGRAMQSALALARHELRKRAQVTVDLQPVPPVRGSERKLGQVFVNLLVNAAQALPVGEAGAHAIRVSVRHEGAEVVAEVQDTGAGMPPEVLAHVFEPFFTTKAPGDGTGLGLSICHGIVTGFGGRIEVESRPGEGSRFRVRLPIQEA